MKDKEQIQQEAEELIEVFRKQIGTLGFTNFKEISTNCAIIHVEGLINSYKHSIEVVRQTVEGTDKINAIRPLRDRFTELTQIKEYLQSKLK